MQGPTKQAVVDRLTKAEREIVELRQENEKLRTEGSSESTVNFLLTSAEALLGGAKILIGQASDVQAERKSGDVSSD